MIRKNLVCLIIFVLFACVQNYKNYVEVTKELKIINTTKTFALKTFAAQGIVVAEILKQCRLLFQRLAVNKWVVVVEWRSVGGA